MKWIEGEDNLEDLETKNLDACHTKHIKVLCGDNDENS